MSIFCGTSRVALADIAGHWHLLALQLQVGLPGDRVSENILRAAHEQTREFRFATLGLVGHCLSVFVFATALIAVKDQIFNRVLVGFR